MYILAEMYGKMKCPVTSAAPAEDTETPGNSYVEVIDDVEDALSTLNEIKMGVSQELGSDDYRRIKQQLNVIINSINELNYSLYSNSAHNDDPVEEMEENPAARMMGLNDTSKYIK